MKKENDVIKKLSSLIDEEHELTPITSYVVCILIEKVEALSSRVEHLENLLRDSDFVFNK